MVVTTLGAVLGLLVGIVLIVKKTQPVYALMLGALIGALIGGASLENGVAFMLEGAKGIVPAVLRILSSGVLAGVLIKTGAAASIADTLILRLGKKQALIGLSVSTMVLTAVGVFVDIAVITVAPLALLIAKRLEYSKVVVLLALIGGGKAGNIISPNPNTIAIASNLKIELGELMYANLLPALCGLLATIALSYALLHLHRKKNLKESFDEELSLGDLPPFKKAILGPLAAIFLLSLRPLFGINIDPLIALPVGGLVLSLVLGKLSSFNEHAQYGLLKMVGVAVLLLGTGAIAGVVKHSNLQNDLLTFLHFSNLPAYLLAPFSGILMSAATASTTAGASIASAMFAPLLGSQALSALSAGAMIHTGATVFDSLPHGSFFHATMGAVRSSFVARLKILPFEFLIGLCMSVACILLYK